MDILKQFFSNPFIVSFGSVIATLLFTKIPERIIESITAKGKIRRQRQEESLNHIYLPIFKVIYQHDFYQNVSYNEIRKFIDTLDLIFRNDIIAVPPTIFGNMLTLKERILKINTSTAESVDWKTKTRFTELKTLLLRRYYSLRRKFYHQDIGIKEIFDSLSPTKYVILWVYALAGSVGAINYANMQQTGHFYPKGLTLEAISIIVAVIMLVIMKKLSD